jgi:hypothetical protein
MPWIVLLVLPVPHGQQTGGKKTMKTVILALCAAALLAVPTATALVDEKVELPPELQDATGCEGVRIIITDEGEATAYFYHHVPDPVTGEPIEEECDPLA